jgi:hypothetical protein
MHQPALRPRGNSGASYDSASDWFHEIIEFTNACEAVGSERHCLFGMVHRVIYLGESSTTRNVIIADALCSYCC